jgi:hypothetical protein
LAFMANLTVRPYGAWKASACLALAVRISSLYTNRGEPYLVTSCWVCEVERKASFSNLAVLGSVNMRFSIHDTLKILT